MDFKIAAGMLSRLFFAYSGISCIPMLAAFLFDKGNIVTFAANSGIAVAIGLLLLCIGKRRQEHLGIRDALFIMSSGWLSICFLGMIPYIIAMPGMDLITCLFESTSMWTTTGITTFESFGGMPIAFIVWRTIGHWVGAVGVIMLFIMIVPQMSSGSDVLMTADLSGRGMERTLPSTKKSALVIIAIFFSLNALCAILLMLGGMNVWEALNLAMATASTGGISFFKDGVMVFKDTYSQVICLSFMFLSAINFTLWFKVLRGDWRGVREDAEHRYYCLWIIIAGCLLTFSLWEANYYDFWQSVKYGFMMGLSYISTAGFAFDHIDNWPAMSQVIFVLLMFTGGCSASTAGGLKIIRCAIVTKAFWQELKRILHPGVVYTVEYGGRAIPQSKVNIMVKFFFLYFFIFGVLTLLASWGGMGLREAVTMVAACLSSVGCSLGSISQESNYSTVGLMPRFVAVLAMILGRIEFVTMLAVFHPKFWQEK